MSAHTYYLAAPPELLGKIKEVLYDIIKTRNEQGATPKMLGEWSASGDYGIIINTNKDIGDITKGLKEKGIKGGYTLVDQKHVSEYREALSRIRSEAETVVSNKKTK